MGTKFSFNLMKMLRKQSPTQDSNKSINKAERTLFNSELVAALYKELGIFDQQKSAAQYWPGCLSSENKKLLILKGKLQQEQLIDFSYI
ncbi:unnamed protein product [Paramecium sonneborni]|uniref:Uncharacterized protein n=1 Tax=Paramecium sonneborni TaxID=65129 RepID=A0A8S1QTJ4_9CILI|nr:unnamed protein product [Paramecium sonneborni]